MKEFIHVPIFQRGASYMRIFDERSVLDDLQRFDSQAVARVYDHYYSAIYRFIFFRLGDKSTSEDIASDVFMRLLEALQRRQAPRSNLKGWLLGTASHAVNDHLRQKYRRNEQPISEALPDQTPGVQSGFDQKEQDHSLQLAYSRLTVEQQNVLALRFGQDCTLAETAALMKKNINSVKALQFRALAALQRELATVNHE